MDVGTFIDGAEWVMAPNVIGMGMYADGGRMSTSRMCQVATISKMTDFCGGCSFDRKHAPVTRRARSPRTGIFWIAIVMPFVRTTEWLRLRNLDRLSDIEEVRNEYWGGDRLIAGTIYQRYRSR